MEKTEDELVLEMLTDCGHSWAEERAQRVLKLNDDFKAGSLSEEEFAGEAFDLVGKEDLDNEADDLNTKALLVTATLGVAQVI